MNKGVGQELKLNKCLISEKTSRSSCPLIPPENSEEKNLLLAKWTQFGHNARSGNLLKKSLHEEQKVYLSQNEPKGPKCVFFSWNYKKPFFFWLQNWLLRANNPVKFGRPKALVCTRGLTRKSRLNFEVIPESFSYESKQIRCSHWLATRVRTTLIYHRKTVLTK